MCAWLKQLPTGRRGRNKEERHRKLLICAPDCQSATGALHYRHEERSSAFSNPSVLFNYTRAPRTNTHTHTRGITHAHNSMATKKKQCRSPCRVWHTGFSSASRRRRNESLSQGWGERQLELKGHGWHSAHGRLPSMHLSAVFQPLLTYNKSKHISTSSHQVRSLF